jgi:molybdopterin-guanine dinucleotide biosynthesis adapter protein
VPPKRIIGFVGASNSGKTTLICELIPLIESHFESIGVLKHTHHVGPSRHGDTQRFLEAGAFVAILAAERSAWRFDDDQSQPIRFDNADPGAVLTDDIDLWIVEGFKQVTSWPRLLIHRGGDLIVDPASVDAVICDHEVPRARLRFSSADYAAIVDFIVRITAP